MAACLLIHSMKMQMLFLASKLPHSFTACSSLGVAAFVHNCGLGFRLAHTFMPHSCPYCCHRRQNGVTAVPGAHLFSPRKEEEESEILRSRFVAALPGQGPVCKTACLAAFCERGDTMWSPRRRITWDKWQSHPVLLLVLWKTEAHPA